MLDMRVQTRQDEFLSYWNSGERDIGKIADAMGVEPETVQRYKSRYLRCGDIHYRGGEGRAKPKPTRLQSEVRDECLSYRRLWLAVLRDGISDAIEYRKIGHSGVKNKRGVLDIPFETARARKWLKSKECQTVCALAGLEWEAVYGAVMRAINGTDADRRNLISGTRGDYSGREKGAA